MKKLLIILVINVCLINASKTQSLPVPTNLKAKNAIEAPDVMLSWFVPGIANWFYYFDSTEINLYGGYNRFNVGIMLDTMQLKEYIGYRISKIAIIPTDPSTAYYAKIWQRQGNWTNQLMIQGFDEIQYNEWNVLEISDEILIEEGVHYIFGYYCNNAGNASACYSNTGIKAGYTDLIDAGSGFISSSEMNFPLCWNIKVYIAPNTLDTVPTPDYYKIYRNNEHIDVTELNFYNDSLEKNGLFEYRVSAIYDQLESELSDPATVIYDTNRILKNAILVEEFTSVECVMCPGVANGIRDMVNIGYTIAPVALHTSNYGDDPFTNTDVDEREKYYAKVINSYPTTIIGGNRVLVGGAPYGSVFEYLSPIYQEAVIEKTPLAIDGMIFENYSGGYGVQFNIDPLGIFPDSSIQLHAVLTEDLIHYNWLTVSTVEYVMQKYITSTSGYPLNLYADTIHNFQVLFEIPEMDRKEHYEIVAFLQNKSTHEVLNALYLKFNEIKYHNHVFYITQNQLPLSNATIEIGQHTLVTDMLGKATFMQAYNIDSIPFTVIKDAELLHQGFFNPLDSIITLNVAHSDVNNTLENKIEIFPNPSTETMVISNAKNRTIAMYNVSGVVIKSVIVTTDSFPIDVSNFSQGIYFIKIMDDHGGFFIKKALITHITN